MFHIIRLRKFWYIISLLIIIPGLVSLAVQGLNLGIDFTGGNLLEVRFDKPTAIEDVRAVLADYGLERSPIQKSGKTDFLIRTRVLSEEESGDLIGSLRKDAGEMEILRNEKVGPTIGKELRNKAVLALAVASVLIVIYISWRFEFLQGIAAIAALMHDVLVTVGLLSIFQIPVDSTFVAAILTIIGYSINDTIVIFDRIRENLRYRKKGDLLQDIINNSLWQTMARSINTVLTVLFVLIALYFFGGTTIKHFVLTMIFGVASGAYSSIFAASPLWFDMKGRRTAVRA